MGRYSHPSGTWALEAPWFWGGFVAELESGEGDTRDPARDQYRLPVFVLLDHINQPKLYNITGPRSSCLQGVVARCIGHAPGGHGAWPNFCTFCLFLKANSKPHIPPRRGGSSGGVRRQNTSGNWSPSFSCRFCFPPTVCRNKKRPAKLIISAPPWCACKVHVLSAESFMPGFELDWANASGSLPETIW